MPVRSPAISLTLLRLALLGLAILWLPVERSFAEAISYPDIADPLPGGGNRTYGDLVRLVVPGSDDAGASGSGVIPLRHIDGTDMSGFEPVSVDAPRIAAMPVHSGGRDRVALLLNLGASRHDVSDFVVLALFEAGGEPRLLDAASIGFDRHTSFGEPPRLEAGPGDDLIVTRSTHFNPYQGYSTTALILARDDRLELVAAISTFDDRDCAYERTQRLDFDRSAEETLPDIVARVTELTAVSKEDCGEATVPEPGTRTITVTYRWDAAGQRYSPDSDAFDVLARKNEARF